MKNIHIEKVLVHSMYFKILQQYVNSYINNKVMPFQSRFYSNIYQ